MISRAIKHRWYFPCSIKMGPKRAAPNHGQNPAGGPGAIVLRATQRSRARIAPVFQSVLSRAISKASLAWMQFDEKIVLPLALPTARPPAKSAGSAEAPFCHYKDGYSGILLAQQCCLGGWKGIFISFPMLLPGPAFWKTSPRAQQAWKQGRSPSCLKSLHLNAHANVK